MKVMRSVTHASLSGLEAAQTEGKSKRVPSLRSAVWDAIVDAIVANRLQWDDTLIIVSDGQDNSNTHNLGDVEKVLRNRQLRVFAFDFTDQVPTPEVRSAEANLQMLAESNGGFFNIFQGSGRSPSISRQEQAKFSGIGYFLARSAFFPYQLSLRLDANATGKLDVEVVNARGSGTRTSKLWRRSEWLLPSPGEIYSSAGCHVGDRQTKKFGCPAGGVRRQDTRLVREK
jgi:hypothetical protein